MSRGNMAQLPGHLTRATDNGLTETELLEVITHLAFYAGWPQAMSALAVAKEFFRPGRAGGRRATERARRPGAPGTGTARSR